MNRLNCSAEIGSKTCGTLGGQRDLFVHVLDDLRWAPPRPVGLPYLLPTVFFQDAIQCVVARRFFQEGIHRVAEVRPSLFGGISVGRDIQDGADGHELLAFLQ